MISPNGIRAVFFDLDGTLRHNLPSGSDVFADYAAQIGLPLTPEDRRRALRWEHYYWANSPELLGDRQEHAGESRAFWLNYSRRQLLELGAGSPQADELAARVAQYMQEAYHPRSVVPADVQQVLPLLQKAGFFMAVVSNREKPFQDELETLGLAPYFSFSLAGGELDAWKPEPEIFIHACGRAGVTPAQSLYVGDSYFADVLGARRAGLQPVLYDPRGLFPEAGCPVLSAFTDLPKVLEDL